MLQFSGEESLTSSVLHFSRVRFASRKVLRNFLSHHMVAFNIRFLTTFCKTSFRLDLVFISFLNFVSVLLFSTYISFNSKIKNFSFWKTVFLAQVFSSTLEWRRRIVFPIFKTDRNKVVFFLCRPFSPILLMILLKRLAGSVCSFLFVH